VGGDEVMRVLHRRRAILLAVAGVTAIDGVPVPTFHHVEVDTLEGAQRGTTMIDYWYTVESFLLVRMERSVRIRTESPLGSVTYSESGTWQLRSLQPLR